MHSTWKLTWCHLSHMTVPTEWGCLVRMIRTTIHAVNVVFFGIVGHDCLKWESYSSGFSLSSGGFWFGLFKKNSSSIYLDLPLPELREYAVHQILCFAMLSAAGQWLWTTKNIALIITNWPCSWRDNMASWPSFSSLGPRSSGLMATLCTCH